MKIYLASSDRDALQPSIVAALTALGHQVHDPRNPGAGHPPFTWKLVDPAWHDWNDAAFIAAVKTDWPTAAAVRETNALYDSECCLVLLPGDSSSSILAGMAVSFALPVIFANLGDQPIERALMFRAGRVVEGLPALEDELRKVAKKLHGQGALAAVLAETLSEPAQAAADLT